MKTFEGSVGRYIARVKQSGAMGKSERRLRLLEHLLNSEAQGQGKYLKAYSIGLDVFGKPEDFDPSTDSIVRVEMGRVRLGLVAFEASEFADTDIEVSIPIGGYQPVISPRLLEADVLPVNATVTSTSSAIPKGSVWKTLALVIVCAIVIGVFGWQAFLPIGGGNDPEKQIAIQVQNFEGAPELGLDVSQSLRNALSRNKAFSVLSDRGSGKINPDAEFVLRGRVSVIGGDHIVSVELVSTQSNSIVWAKSTDLHGEDEIADQITAFNNELRLRLFAAVKDFLNERDPERMSPEQLFFMATWVPGSGINAKTWEIERVNLAELALKKNPDSGAAHSVMADKLAYLANISQQFASSETTAASRFHAQRAMELAHLDPDVVFNVAQSQWHRGEIEQSHASMRRVLELDDSHDRARFFELVIPFTCDRPPDNILADAITFDQRLSADNPIRWATLSWISWLHVNRQEYQEALIAEEAAAQIFQIPYTYMRHAMLLNKLGRAEEAVEAILRQKTNWPDVSADHFAKVTYPTFCRGQPLRAQSIEDYEELAAAMKGRI